MNAIETATREADPATDELAALAAEYGRRAYRYALQIVGDREEAMDIAQEAFLRLHRHWARRDRSRAFAPWLYAIVRNLAIDALRRRAGWTADAADLLQADPGRGPEVLAENGERGAALWAAIRRLPGAVRDVFLLRELHGLSYLEIGQALGVPASTVNNRLHDARVRLRRELRDLL